MTGWALKPTSFLNASSPKVLSGNETAKLQATATARTVQRQQQARQVRPENFDLKRFPVIDANEKHWRNILWTTAVVEPQEAFVAEALDQVLALMTRSGLSDSQMRTVDMATKIGTQLYLSNPTLYSRIGQRFTEAVAASRDPEWVAVSLSGLAKANPTSSLTQQLSQQVQQRFPNWSGNPYLQTTLREVANLRSTQSAPPLRDLLNWTIAPKQPHLYVLCQPDRYVVCQTVLKDRSGQFVRQSNGELWSVPLLLRSLHNLSWNFVRGQTPQGVYRMEGTVPQPDDEFFRAYGQFSLVNLFVPFESGVKQFLPSKKGRFTGSVQEYQKLLPPSWRDHVPMQQSYWAGRIGRSEFRIHGSGESPDFFSGKDKNPDTYNWNPTIGCLSALELYNEQGQLVAADMPKILSALESVGGKRFSGYMMVVDLPGTAGKPLAIDQIDAAIRDSKSAKPQIKADARADASSTRSEALSMPSEIAESPRLSDSSVPRPLPVAY
ncbi:hypothetical protein H6F43_08605 [Leptolyngbya sp. FACHB-36]|uniref:hypothetical protein n=1 Tax=Leptolyngbya sp. FACHB-36 TaxID=2692808 RepID=UPI0016808C08|nr:hypothetical protein [Leptolyngbya sp. FACHB-36]MBD2020245.1 hypothetical protein [Leptolyngbya sp. FACHB-36]